MGWVVWIAASLVLLGAIVTLVGYRLPQAHSVSRTVRLPLAPDAVYALLSDVDKYPAWRPKVKSLIRQADHHGMPAWTEVAGGNTIPLRFERMDRPSLLVARISDPSLPFGGTWTYRISPEPQGSLLVMTEDGEVSNPVFRFMSRFGFGHAATLDEFVRAIEARGR
jgi:hypothetical protein